MTKNITIIALAIFSIWNLVALKLVEQRLSDLDAFVRNESTLAVDADLRIEKRVSNLERRG